MVTVSCFRADLKEFNIQIEEGQRIERGLRIEVTSITGNWTA